MFDLIASVAVLNRRITEALRRRVSHADDACTNLPGAEQRFDAGLITREYPIVGLDQERDVGVDKVVRPILAEKLSDSACCHVV